jgi:hypothetical protein
MKKYLYKNNEVFISFVSKDIIFYDLNGQILSTTVNNFFDNAKEITKEKPKIILPRNSTTPTIPQEPIVTVIPEVIPEPIKIIKEPIVTIVPKEVIVTPVPIIIPKVTEVSKDNKDPYEDYV